MKCTNCGAEVGPDARFCFECGRQVTDPAGTPAAGVSIAFLSGIQDAVVLVAGILSFFVPYVPVLLVAFLLFFFNRIRKRRGRKFGGLRILGD